MDLFASISSARMEPWTYSDPPTIEPYWFEHWETEKWRKWMAKNWGLSVVASALYLLLIFGGQRIMKHRKPFDLKMVMALWNIGLAAFSTCGFLRTVPELYQVVTGPNGFYRSVCVRDIFNESSAFWAWLFTLSKLVELGDTAFIVLRKRPLNFLHWYHHVTVLIFCWAHFHYFEPILRWFGVVNMFVHCLMYTYYALKAINVPVPRSVSITITSIQMSQMVIGIGVNLYAIYYKTKGEPCARSEEGINLHLMMYGSYLILFANYFYQAYIVKKTRKKAD